VRETLELFSKLYPKPRPMEDIVAACSLEEFIDRDNRKLSGGQRQRMLLGIALVNDPDLLFLDEPTTGLDPHARRNFWRLIEGIKARGKTVILTTHYMDEAEYLCDDIIVMDHGHIIESGRPRELLLKHFGEAVIRIPSESAVPRERGLLLPRRDRGRLRHAALRRHRRFPARARGDEHGLTRHNGREAQPRRPLPQADGLGPGMKTTWEP
jgi:ABC-2 type transport system ATP-binding protein